MRTCNDLEQPNKSDNRVEQIASEAAESFGRQPAGVYVSFLLPVLFSWANRCFKTAIAAIRSAAEEVAELMCRINSSKSSSTATVFKNIF